MPSTTMRAASVLPAGTWDSPPVDRVLIDWDRRHRRRILLQTETGADLLLDLAHAARLRHGDGLLLDQGGVVQVQAQPEALLELHAPSPDALVRIAWHLGNRHLPVQLMGDRVRIRADHVIADMVRGLGGHVVEISAPFDPEAGAYSGEAGPSGFGPNAHAAGYHHHGDDDAH